MLLRVGVNVGEVIAQDATIYGDAVNLAARLQEIAASGGVCVSTPVHDDVRDRAEAAFADGGAPPLKNISRPIRIWRWSPAAALVPAAACAGMSESRRLAIVLVDVGIGLYPSILEAPLRSQCFSTGAAAISPFMAFLSALLKPSS